jgi:hypothetical protein
MVLDDFLLCGKPRRRRKTIGIACARQRNHDEQHADGDRDPREHDPSLAGISPLTVADSSLRFKAIIVGRRGCRRGR